MKKGIGEFIRFHLAPALVGSRDMRIDAFFLVLWLRLAKTHKRNKRYFRTE